MGIWWFCEGAMDRYGCLCGATLTLTEEVYIHPHTIIHINCGAPPTRQQQPAPRRRQQVSGHEPGPISGSSDSRTSAVKSGSLSWETA